MSAQPNFSTILWSIWRYPNEKLWKGPTRTPQVTVSLGYDIQTNWFKAQMKASKDQASNLRQNEDDRWSRPPDKSMKCNVDAALFK